MACGNTTEINWRFEDNIVLMMGKMAGKRDGNAGQEQGEQEYGYIQALLTVFVAGKGVGESKDVETLML